MLLAVDAGNTNVVFALFEGRNIKARWRIATDPRRTGDEYAVWLMQLLQIRGIKREEIKQIIVSTVVPRALHNLEVLARNYFFVEPLIAGVGAAGYAIDIDGDGDGWIRLTEPSTAAVLTVTISAGLAADWASLPAAIRQGAAMLAAYLYDNRDGASAPPAAASSAPTTTTRSPTTPTAASRSAACSRTCSSPCARATART